MDKPKRKRSPLPTTNLHRRALIYALTAACHHANVAVVRYCIAQGADVRGFNDSGHYSPLHAVCETDGLYSQWEPMGGTREREKIVQMLLAAGADPNQISSGMGVPPVYCAARRDSWAMVKFLVDAGADVNLRDPSIETHAILWAPLTTGELGIVQLLLDAGADISSLDGQGMDVATVAALSLGGDDRDEALRMIVTARPNFDWTESQQVLQRACGSFLKGLNVTGRCL